MSYIIHLFFTILFLKTNFALGDICSALSDQRWDVRKEKCVSCKTCKPGQFRNHTEQYVGLTGDHGDEECLPCRECPEGTYSAGGSESCLFCVMDCLALNREYDTFCTRTSDAQCGSCLSGYEDTYRSSKMPCESIRSSDKRSKQPPETGNIFEAHRLPDDSKLQNNKASADTSIIVISTGLVVIVVAVVGGVFVVGPYILRQRRLQSRDIEHVDYTNSIETDGFLDDSHPNSFELADGQLYMTMPPGDLRLAAGELSTSPIPEPRGELSHPDTSTRSDHVIHVPDISHRPRVVVYSQNKICSCSKTLCKCRKFTELLNDIIVKKSDKYITTTADSICHDPIALLRSLGLDDSIIYQEYDSRDRDPVNVTEKEVVLRLLNKWIERSQTPPSLKDLTLALCKANFHDICFKIKSFTLIEVQRNQRSEESISHT